MEAVAEYSFDGAKDDDLSFKQGDVIKVRNMEDGNWYHAELRGKKGFIPSNYVTMKPHDWYQGKLSRTDAESFLMQTNREGHHIYQDGTFIVRDCESDRNQFSLSVKHGSCPQHYKILSNNEGKYYLWPKQSFDSINELINHHRTNSVAQGVSILLRDLTQRKGKQPLPPRTHDKQSSSMFKALYDFKPESLEELAFRKGDIIQFLSREDENWWVGEIVGTKKKGLFPKNYVEEVPM